MEDRKYDRLKEEVNKLRLDLIERLERLEEDKPYINLLKMHPDAVVPRYQTKDAAGMDLVACCDEPMTIFPDGTACVPTGIAISLPPGFEAQVRPRSSLAIQGVAVANSPGTIDADYRGEIKVIIRNHGKTLVIHKGDRIAQLVIARVVQAKLTEVKRLDETERGDKGFGSTGT